MDSIIRGCNVYVDETNQRLRLDSFKLPVLKREMEQHFLGGGYYKVDMPNEISPLESEMNVNGSHGDLRSRFGREPGDWTTVHYYERLLDITGNTGKNTGRIVTIKGLLNEVDQPNVEGVKAKDKTKLKWSTIFLYRDVVDGVVIHKFDILRNTLIINGINYTAEHNRMLAV